MNASSSWMTSRAILRSGASQNRFMGFFWSPIICQIYAENGLETCSILRSWPGKYSTVSLRTAELFNRLGDGGGVVKCRQVGMPRQRFALFAVHQNFDAVDAGNIRGHGLH